MINEYYMSTPRDIDEYLNRLPEAQKTALQQLRKDIASIVPESREAISTNVPAFKYKGRYLVSFSATKYHLALLVMQGDAMKSVANELKNFNTGSRIIRFSQQDPLPRDILEKILRFRQAEIDRR
jgi:uncharacterized protein YdhG (YjbR/CyaY superfamily)